MVDRFLTEHVQPDGTVTLKKLLARPGPEGRNCVARLQTLTKLKLAVEERPGVWRLTGGWKETLTRLGEQNDRIERLYPIVGEKAAEYQFVDPKLPLSNFGAVVVGKGLHDELSGEMFVAVQATHGQGYYIPIRPEVAETLHRGDTIRVGFKAEDWLKPADKAIAQVAKENGGVYAPREHQRELETKQATKSDADTLSPANLVEGNVRRLERLVAYGLASQLPEGRWRVPSDLIAQLESRERTHPRPRLQIDKFSPAKREPAAPLITDLEKERMAIGEAAAQRLGLAFVANPQRFRGQLVPAPAGPSGTEYVQVVDYRHRQLALVPKPKDAERLRGKVVTVSRDPAGRLSIRDQSGDFPLSRAQRTDRHPPRKERTHGKHEEESWQTQVRAPHRTAGPRRSSKTGDDPHRGFRGHRAGAERLRRMGEGVGIREADTCRGHVQDDRLRAPRPLRPRQVLAGAQANGRSDSRDDRNRSTSAPAAMPAASSPSSGLPDRNRTNRSRTAKWA